MTSAPPARASSATSVLHLAGQRRVVGRMQPELNLGAAGRHLQRFANQRQR